MNIYRNISPLSILFYRWIGTADHPDDNDRLLAVDLDEFDSYKDVILSDLSTRLDSEDNIAFLNREIVCELVGLKSNSSDRPLERYFDSHLIAAYPPKDEVAFIDRLIFELFAKHPERNGGVSPSGEILDDPE